MSPSCSIMYLTIKEDVQKIARRRNKMQNDFEVPKGFLIVDSDHWEELLETERWADALRNNGVDNWEGYDYAMDYLREGDDENAYDDLIDIEDDECAEDCTRD